MKIKKLKVEDIDYTVLSTLCQSTIPWTVSVTVIDLDDPHDTSHTAIVSVITERMFKHFLADHFSWFFLFMDEEIPANEATTYFAYLWNDFYVRHMDKVEKAVQAERIKYNPALTFFRDESGDSDKITYGGITVSNSGGVSTSHTKLKGTVDPSIGSADTDGYRATTPGTITDGAAPTSSTKVGTYDTSDSVEKMTEVENTGDTASKSGSTQSAKTQTSGNDTHSRDMHFEGSDALHTSTQMVEAEISMRLSIDIGKKLLELFASENLYLSEGDDDECNS